MINRIIRLASRYGFGKGKKLALPEYVSKGYQLDNLHLGCGNIHIDNWCNIDVMKTGATDVVLDITTMPGFIRNSVNSIYSCHVLEHFSHQEVKDILSTWHSILQPGGKIYISVPDLDAITRIYQKNIEHFQVPGNEPWIALIYGGQKDKYDFHKTGFNYCWLKYLLEKTGFKNIEKYPHSPHFIDGVVDNSLATVPFDEYISLNIKAVK